MAVRIEYLSVFKTPPKLVSNAEGETVEVILTYEVHPPASQLPHASVPALPLTTYEILA